MQTKQSDEHNEHKCLISLNASAAAESSTKRKVYEINDAARIIHHILEVDRNSKVYTISQPRFLSFCNEEFESNNLI